MAWQCFPLNPSSHTHQSPYGPEAQWPCAPQEKPLHPHVFDGRSTAEPKQDSHVLVPLPEHTLQNESLPTQIRSIKFPKSEMKFLGRKMASIVHEKIFKVQTCCTLSVCVAEITGGALITTSRSGPGVTPLANPTACLRSISALFATAFVAC